MRTPLSRRTFLRGLTGTGVLVGLCPLDAMFDGNGLAYADTATPSRRFVLWYKGNGVPTRGYFSGSTPEHWVPQAQGPGFALSTALQPFAAVRARLRLLTNVRLPKDPHAESFVSEGTGTHEGNMSLNLTGFGNFDPNQNPSNLKNSYSYQRLGGATPDFVAAKSLGGTRLGHLPLVVCPAYNANTPVFNCLTFDDSGRGITPIASPQALFTKLFSGAPAPMPSPSPADAGTAAPTSDGGRQRRRSVLDAVLGDAARLQRELGGADRQKLDAHLTAIRELEVSLFPPVADAGVATPPPAPPPPPGASCTTPAAPAASTDYTVVAQQMNSLLALALACNQTNVASYMLTKNTSQQVMSWLGFSGTYHNVSHGSDGAQVVNDVLKITQWEMRMLADLVTKLDVPEGAGRLLDNTILVATCENGGSQHHAGFETPMVVFGGQALGVKGDVHWRAPSGTYAEQVWFTVLKQLGVPVTKFGTYGTALVNGALG
ncbi:MAG: DUF1552 domain-containing protein [Myxococcaceae bacterium]|nr:DUF1552 domain-containing protein [Myxococcaceae bacterium]